MNVSLHSTAQNNYGVRNKQKQQASFASGKLFPRKNIIELGTGRSLGEGVHDRLRETMSHMAGKPLNYDDGLLFAGPSYSKKLMEQLPEQFKTELNRIGSFFDSHFFKNSKKKNRAINYWEKNIVGKTTLPEKIEVHTVKNWD